MSKWHVVLMMVAAAGMAMGCAAAARAADVWIAGPLTPAIEGAEQPGKDDPKAAVRLTGARNGAFSAQIVVQLAEPAAGPKAQVGDLKLKGGDATIPASAVEVRYALPTGVNGLARTPKGQAIFDALADAPRTEGRTHPVWVTVHVPADAKAGLYEGAVTVAGRAVPLTISVAGWTLPDPKDYVTWVDFVQSPESVAMQYNVPFWSDEHFKLIGTSFDQLAPLGNKTLYVPLMCQTHFGNAESMVRWVKTDKEKEFGHDFSIAEKYVDLYQKHVGTPTRVILYIYESFLGGSHGRTPEECQRGVPFTLVDPKTGEATTAAGPCHNNPNPAYPNYPADTKAFWKPVLDGMRERLNQRGIGDSSIVIGMHPDLGPGKPTFAYLKEIAPWARWAEQGHGRSTGSPYGYSTLVWGAYWWQNKPGKRVYGWKVSGGCPQAYFQRDIWKLPYVGQLAQARMLGEMNITGKQSGFGRMSADFWPVREGSRGQRYSIVNRYPLSNWAQLTLRMTPYLFPGPKGAFGSIRLESLRAGVEECEARIFIEQALTDKDKLARLGDELAAKVQAVLDQRVETFSVKGFDPAAFDLTSAGEKLFAAAAEVADKLK